MSEPAPMDNSEQIPDRSMSRILAVSLLSSAVIAAGLAGSNQPAAARGVGLRDCLPYFDLHAFPDHQYEVCTAYVANSAEIALEGLYKFGNNTRGYLADPAKHHFETRYWAGPRASIEREVNTWPATSRIIGNRVKETVSVLSVTSSEKLDRGLVRTKESWKVTTPNGKVVHNEPEHTKNITMCRGKLSGHPLHEWFVVKYSRDPQFNCIAFDKSHGIKP